MAKFANLTFTSQGTQMLVQAQNSHTLTFTCGKLGSGVLADTDDISKFTDLKSPKMTLPIVSVDDSNEEKLVLTFDTSNTELEEGFVSREIGIFAKLDNSSETLYAYSNAGNNYDYIPSKDTPSDENRLVVNLVVSSSANISVQIDKSIVYTHKSDVEEMIATHDASDTAHETRFKLFEKIADFGNDIIKKLALTTAITAITALETGSWFGQLLKMVLTASGVKYNIAQNGYVCLGSFFGGLIIQWGTSIHGWVSFPVMFNSYRVIITNHQGTASYGSKPRESDTLGGFTLDVSNNSDISMDAYWIAIGL
ncbi:hypothetical protein [uncultured Megasphaera sp.]|uniref:gp53-like domain-containing protein n=1 Tax=uncultured Megasphaera sp. TaxID=165188 RepID=UPI0026323EBB|nr:hypothetical protein [uncultured Megasphaera sp.]